MVKLKLDNLEVDNCSVKCETLSILYCHLTGEKISVDADRVRFQSASIAAHTRIALHGYSHVEFIRCADLLQHTNCSAGDPRVHILQNTPDGRQTPASTRDAMPKSSPVKDVRASSSEHATAAVSEAERQLAELHHVQSGVMTKTQPRSTLPSPPSDAAHGRAPGSSRAAYYDKSRDFPQCLEASPSHIENCIRPIDFIARQHYKHPWVERTGCADLGYKFVKHDPNLQMDIYWDGPGANAWFEQYTKGHPLWLEKMIAEYKSSPTCTRSSHPPIHPSAEKASPGEGEKASPGEGEKAGGKQQDHVGLKPISESVEQVRTLKQTLKK